MHFFGKNFLFLIQFFFEKPLELTNSTLKFHGASALLRQTGINSDGDGSYGSQLSFKYWD